MAEADASVDNNARISKEAPQLVAVLKEMNYGLDTVRAKIEALTAKVKADNFPTTDGISYLDAKYLLLLNYCQSLVYYLLRKAKGLSIEGHPVVRSLVEIRLFLEKVRPIDKKLQYQIGKLAGVTPRNVVENRDITVEETETAKEEEKWLKYRPNPDMLISKTDATLEKDGVYRPPKLVPATMDEDKMSRQERNAMRKEKETLRQARRSAYVRELMNDLEGKPEEVREDIGTESAEVTKYMEKMEQRAQQEEELFIRAPLTKAEKQKMRRLKKPRNGLLDLTESFYDEIKTLPLEDNGPEQSAVIGNGNSSERKFKKQKRRH
ncbi:neuroguidin [Coffea eugenioides]|uniref:neuroguidin n=1 Tax=Coffea eugenioides TaxID=49369 RepID=UPI000F610D21|nr:neuroguidin [Coffea eugenioides]